MHHKDEVNMRQIWDHSWGGHEVRFQFFFEFSDGHFVQPLSSADLFLFRGMAGMTKVNIPLFLTALFQCCLLTRYKIWLDIYPFWILLNDWNALILGFKYDYPTGFNNLLYMGKDSRVIPHFCGLFNYCSRFGIQKSFQAASRESCNVILPSHWSLLFPQVEWDTLRLWTGGSIEKRLWPGSKCSKKVLQSQPNRTKSLTFHMWQVDEKYTELLRCLAGAKLRIPT